MNYLEGLRRLTVIISIAVAILTIAFFIVVDNSVKQDYLRLTNTLKEIEVQKEQISANSNDFIKNYMTSLKKNALQDFKILEIEKTDQNKTYLILWQKEGLPQENEMNLLLQNKLYLEGVHHETESARMLLGYLTGLNDFSEIKSRLTKTKIRMYFLPILYGAGSFFMVWIIFYCIQYVSLGFKKEKI